MTKEDIPDNSITIPFALIGFIIFLIVQTATSIWWAASMTTKMDFILAENAKLTNAIEANTKDRWTSKQALAEKDDRVANDLAQSIQIKEIDQRVTVFQARYRPILELIESKYRPTIE